MSFFTSKRLFQHRFKHPILCYHQLLTILILRFTYVQCDNVMWNITSYPVKFGNTAELSCFISDSNNACSQRLRQWIGGQQYTSLCQNMNCFNVTKYHVKVETPCSYTLMIQDFSMYDVNCDYSCFYGTKWYRKNLQLNSKDFVAVPVIIHKRKMTLTEDKIDIQLSMEDVYPSPWCYASLVGKNITEDLQVNISKKEYFYDLEVELILPITLCRGNVTIYCHFGNEEKLVLNEYIGDCKGNTQPTDFGILFAGEIAGIVVGIAVVPVVFVYLWRKRRQRRKRKGRNSGDKAGVLTEEDKSRYNDLMQSSKTEKRYFVRIMIVGKESAGKTCLLRRLLNEDISDVTSTDGVDIVVRRCKINIKDGKWKIGKDIEDNKVSRKRRAINLDAENKDTPKKQVDETKKINISQGFEMASYQKHTTIDAKVNLDKNEDANEFSSLIISDNITTDEMVNLEKNEDTNYKAQKESLPLLIPEDLMSRVFVKSTVKTPSNPNALCELWDFAGQKEFYATHQAFLTSCAVYLVVADMKDEISKQGLSQCFTNYQNIGEYIEFWFDSIHCHRTADQPVGHGHFDPPILLVFTGSDKYDETDMKKREKELNNQIDQVLGYQSKYQHLHRKIFLSNLRDTDEEFEKLRYAIYETASNMENWGHSFPCKWILLEHLIEINKNDGTNVITFNDMLKLAKHPDINILEENDLLLFLRFQHNRGNIIFFENVPDLIILRPQWLTDAFRCLVSDRFHNSRLHHRDDWELYTRRGIISEMLISELFESKDGSQFSAQQYNLQKVMEQLDILVKIEKSNYIIPSMMPSAEFKDVCEKFAILTEKCKRTSWLCYKFEFLPPYFFNHISAWFIRNYNPSKLDSGIALYRGICVFDIDRSGCIKILVTMSNDTIALQAVSFSEESGFGSTCSDIYSEVTQFIEEIKKRYIVKVSFKLHFKCSDGYYHKDTFEYDRLTSERECFCPEHKKAHLCDLLYLPWMKNEGTKR